MTEAAYNTWLFHKNRNLNAAIRRSKEYASTFPRNKYSSLERNPSWICNRFIHVSYRWKYVNAGKKVGWLNLGPLCFTCRKTIITKLRRPAIVFSLIFYSMKCKPASFKIIKADNQY